MKLFIESPCTSYFVLLLGGGEGEEAILLPGGGEDAPDISSVCFLLMG